MEAKEVNCYDKKQQKNVFKKVRSAGDEARARMVPDIARKGKLKWKAKEKDKVQRMRGRRRRNVIIRDGFYPIRRRFFGKWILIHR